MDINGVSTEPIRIIGIEASPYSVKLRAYCRYRRIPYLWLSRMPQYYAETKNLYPLLMPVVQHPDGRFETDSTPIILKLESVADPSRTIFTDNPVLNFINLLIEDFADEWLTKCLFHFRFSYAVDRSYAPQWVMDDAHPQATSTELAAYAKAFLKRQIDRMPLVGCTPENAPVIEQSFRQLLDILGPFVGLEKFLFGTRPSLADFGLFGQLKTLCTDPTPQKIIRTTAPRLEHWVRRADDLSGLDGQFLTLEQLDEQVRQLGQFVAGLYLPYLRANFEAYINRENSFSLIILERQFTQPVFKYQAKCFEKLRKYYCALSPSNQALLSERFNLDRRLLAPQ